MKQREPGAVGARGVDATGRSTGKQIGQAAKLNRPPEGENWTWHTKERLGSPAMQSLCVAARRILDCLEIDHLANGGASNGYLKATRTQLEKFGVASSRQHHAWQQLKASGLVRRHCPGMRMAATHTLTWLPHCDGSWPTNDWRKFQPSSETIEPRVTEEFTHGGDY